jgi:uncharacterized membrane protein
MFQTAARAGREIFCLEPPRAVRQLGASLQPRYDLGFCMNCSYCFAEMPEISSYCPICGRAVHAAVDHGEAADIRELLLGALAYFTLIPAVALLSIPATRRSRFVRFHAWQSILFMVTSALILVAMRIIFTLVSIVPFLGSLFAWLLAGVVFLAIVTLWAVLVIKTLQREAYETPWLGHLAIRLSA